MNTTQRIRDEDDLIDLKKEFRNSSLPELLLESHDLNRKEGLKFLRNFYKSDRKLFNSVRFLQPQTWLFIDLLPGKFC